MCIHVSRHLKTTEDLVDNRASPRTESMVAAAVQWVIEFPPCMNVSD